MTAQLQEQMVEVGQLESLVLSLVDNKKPQVTKRLKKKRKKYSLQGRYTSILYQEVHGSHIAEAWLGEF